MTLDEFLKEIDKPPTIWDKITTLFYRVKKLIKDLYYNFKPRKIKQLFQLIKLWWNSWYDIDYSYSLKLLHWGITQLKEGHEGEQIYVNQHKRAKEMKIFLECLRREIEDDYGENDYNDKQWLNKYDRRCKSNMDMLVRYFSKVGRWWI